MTGRATDRWAAALAALHLGHSLWFARLYPDAIHDPDLLAYFVYFANWAAGVTALHDVSYFTVPKPLLVFALGPLASAPAAFAVSALVSSALGALVYLIARDAFGRTPAILASLLLLLDVERATLTLHSSADLYVAFFLFAAIRCTTMRRYVLSGVAIAAATLIKPVALPCVLHLLAVDGDDRRRARLAALVPLLAVPLLFAANVALVGAPFGPARFFAGFDAMSQGELMPTGELVRFVVWVQLVKTSFASTAPLGVIGLVTWVARDRRRLTSPLVLVPMLFLGGYVAMSLRVPFVPFFRFFWPLQVCFSAFIVFAAVETAQSLASERPALRAALCAALLGFLADDLVTRQLHYRTRFAQPFQNAMAFVERARPVLRRERAPGESLLTPLVFLPYALWTLDDARAAPSLIATAEHAENTGDPDWILWVPHAFLDRATRDRVGRLAGSGRYTALVSAGDAALLARIDRQPPLALRAPGAPAYLN